METPPDLADGSKENQCLYQVFSAKRHRHSAQLFSPQVKILEDSGPDVFRPRTPLTDVKNKHFHAGPKLSHTRKFSIDSWNRPQNNLHTQENDTPKKHSVTETASVSTNTSVLDTSDPEVTSVGINTSISNLDNISALVERHQLVDVVMVTDSGFGSDACILVDACTETDTCTATNVSIVTDACQLTNTSMITEAVLGLDVLVLTDACQLTNTSMITEAVPGLDVSVLTDACQLTNTSMITEAVPGLDVAVLTDACQLTNTSMITEAVPGLDVSILTDACLATDVSMLTDPWSGVHASSGTDVCHVVDVSLVTDSVNTLDHSVLAVPTCQTQETMTENNVKDVETVMTPFKMGKIGKRMTAEEIRGQHPRIIANQIETLLASNNRLEKEVSTVARDRDQARSALTETKSKLAVSDKLLSEEKERQGGIISVIEEYHHKTIESLENHNKEKQGRLALLESELQSLKLQWEDQGRELDAVREELLNNSCELERLRLEKEQLFSDELQKMQASLEENSYQRAFLASQQQVREMISEKEELAGVWEDLEISAMKQANLQAAIHEILARTQRTVAGYKHRHDQLVAENQSLLQRNTSLKTDLEIATSECKDLNEDLQNMNDILKRSTDNYAQLEQEHQAVKDELARSQVKVAELDSKIEWGFKVVQDLMETKANLTDQLQDLHKSSGQSLEDLKQANNKINHLETLLDKERQLLSASNEKYLAMTSEYESANNELRLDIKKLTETMASWDRDRAAYEDEIRRCQQHISRQQEKIEAVSKELRALRQVKAVSQSEREEIEEMRNTIQFLEAEKQLYYDAITEYRTRLEAETEVTTSNNRLIEALRSNNLELQTSNDRLLSDLQMSEESLSQKSMDLDLSLTALDNLQDKMASAILALQHRFSSQADVDLTRDKFATPKVGSTRKETSFLSQTLSAFKYSAELSSHPVDASSSDQGVQKQNTSSSSATDADSFTQTNNKANTKPQQNNVQYGAAQPNLGKEAESLISPRDSRTSFSSRKRQLFEDLKIPLNFSYSIRGTDVKPDLSLRYITPQKSSVRKNLSKLYPDIDRNANSTPGFAKICPIPSTIDRTLENMSRMRSDICKSASKVNISTVECMTQLAESESLFAKVKVLDKVFSCLLRTTDMTLQESELVARDLRDDISLLKDKLKFQRCQAGTFKREVTRKTEELAAAKSQSKDLQSRFSEMSQSLHKLQDQQFDIVRLEDEKRELKNTVRSLREEVTLLSTQLEEVIKKFDSYKSGQKSEGTYLREIMYLKKQNHELMMKLFDERDKYKETGEKAVRRMKVLEKNWKTAEAEVSRFDELVEKIRETCVGSQAQTTHPAILQVVRLIDGTAEPANTEVTQSTDDDSD